MDKNLSCSLIQSFIKPFLIPRKAGGDVGPPASSNLFVHTQWKHMKVLEAAFLAFISRMVCVQAYVVCLLLLFGFLKYDLVTVFYSLLLQLFVSCIT